jgi:hypothetical protein
MPGGIRTCAGLHRIRFAGTLAKRSAAANKETREAAPTGVRNRNDAIRIELPDTPDYGFTGIAVSGVFHMGVDAVKVVSSLA